MEASTTTATVRTRSAALDLPAVAAFSVAAVLVGWVAADDGGWWPETWAWTASVTLAASVVVVLLRDPRLGRADLAFLGGLITLGAWTASSALWSPSVPSTVDEAYRVLAYVGAALLCVLVIERRTVPHALGGVLAAIATLGAYALTTRLLPDRLGAFDSSSGGYRLSEPVTYWNGLGILLVLGTLLALGFAARGTALWTRALAAATLPILTSAVYFTFSRGAWVALVLGVAAAVAIDPRRLQLMAAAIAIAPFSLLALWLATRADGQRVVGSSLAQATEDGHALVAPILVLAAASALVSVCVAMVERRLHVPAAVRVTFVTVLLAAIVTLGAAAWIQWGSPVEAADRAWEDLRAQPNATGGDLGDRLLDLSSPGRIDHWRIAWDEFRAHPTIGSGVGTYWQIWAANRPSSGEVRDAHSLYLETLAEMGLIGGALLLFALLMPAIVGLGTRSSPIVPAALGAYAAWLAHAAIDWDRELAGVTLAALVIGAALVVAVRRERGGVPKSQWLALAAAALLMVPAFAGVLSYAPLGSAREALEELRIEQAAEDARMARRFAPWSSTPWVILGDVAAQKGEPVAARAAYREALERDGSSWEVWYALAAVSTGGEQRDALARATELNPNSPAVRELRDSTAASGLAP